jgi:hypothetical protein
LKQVPIGTSEVHPTWKAAYLRHFINVREYRKGNQKWAIQRTFFFSFFPVWSELFYEC